MKEKKANHEVWRNCMFCGYPYDARLSNMCSRCNRVNGSSDLYPQAEPPTVRVHVIYENKEFYPRYGGTNQAPILYLIPFMRPLDPEIDKSFYIEIKDRQHKKYVGVYDKIVEHLISQ